MRFIMQALIGIVVGSLFTMAVYAGGETFEDIAADARNKIPTGAGQPTAQLVDVSGITPRRPTKRVEVARVVDGDTFVLAAGRRVRFYGIDTREIGEACYTQATDRLRELVGDAVLVEPGPREFDKHGRTLRYVYTADGVSIDALMVGEGLAPAWTRRWGSIATNLSRWPRRQASAGSAASTATSRQQPIRVGPTRGTQRAGCPHGSHQHSPSTALRRRAAMALHGSGQVSLPPEGLAEQD